MLNESHMLSAIGARLRLPSEPRLVRCVGGDVLWGLTHDYYSFHFDRAASVAVPARTSGRHRNLSNSGLSLPSTASAMISPKTGANLNPCPLSPAATTNPSRSGSRAIQKCPSCVSQYMHTRV